MTRNRMGARVHRLDEKVFVFVVHCHDNEEFATRDDVSDTAVLTGRCRELTSCGHRGTVEGSTCCEQSRRDLRVSSGDVASNSTDAH